jgi:ABC-type glycerol-3-phosphate transport system substrate-binding protein
METQRPAETGMSRRALLKLATGPLLLRVGGSVSVTSGLAAGCARDQGGVEVFVIWGGAELNQFRRIMDDFSRDSGYPVRIVTVGEHVQELLRARLDANNPPDVAVVSVPSLIKEYAEGGRVVSLDPSLAKNVPQGLRDTVTVGGQLYGLWVKVAHKSLFWYRPSTLADVAPPGTWAELVDIVKRSAAAGRPPLSIGAADGWVVTDWFENILAGVDGGDVYERLARGENQWESDAVSEAFASLAEIWSVPGAFPDGPGAALLTEFEESVVEVFATRRAGLLYGGDFVASVIERFRQAGRVTELPATFRFPPLRGSPPLVVGGDVAAVMTASPGGEELIRWLAEPSSLLGWVRFGGFLSPDRRIRPESYPTQLAQRLAEELQSADTHVHFDLSDQLGGRFAGGQGRGMFRILPEFFAGSTASSADRRAAKRAQTQLANAARLNRA